MAAHLLLLWLGLSLLSGSGQALFCHTCGVLKADGLCKTTKGFCITDDQCFLKKVYEGGRFLYAYQGCGKVCLSKSILLKNVEVISECCNHKYLCNEF